MADAKSKAKTLAAAAGLTLGAVQSVSENSSSPTPIPFGAKTAPGEHPDRAGNPGNRRIRDGRLRDLLTGGAQIRA